MSDSDKEEQIDQFVGVTGVDANRARFYLESAAWDLQLAMSSFYEGGGEEAADDVQPQESQDVSMATDTSRPSASAASRINTLNYLNADSSDDEDQAYYAGGSERSGQQILGPNKKKDANKIVEGLFKSAKDHGAEEKREDDASGASAVRPTFVGSGYRLGETSDDTTVVPGLRKPAMPKKQQDKKLKLWKNGFSVNDGPLRDYNDPTNKAFLDSISKGEVPQELVREAQGGEVNLDMEDHRQEEYVKPKVTVKAFSGAGNMLGSDEPPCFSPTPSTVTSAPGTGGDQPPPQVKIDESQPTTNVQLRLSDGKRMVLKLNHTHKISDIRQHIISTNPQYAASNFCLMTTFPNKELTEESTTLKDANLLNAVIVQRLK